MQSLDIISVNIWQIIISLANLLIMFLIIRRFLFKPVQKMLETRRKQVEDVYAEADEKRAAAIGMKQEYEAKLAAAREEADGLVRSAVQTAQKHYSFVIIDTPPMANVVDAAVLSQYCDGSVFVISQGNVRYRLAQKMIEQLGRSGSKVLGVTFNKVDSKQNYLQKSYYGRFYGKKYGKYGGYGNYGRSDRNSEEEK